MPNKSEERQTRLLMTCRLEHETKAAELKEAVERAGRIRDESPAQRKARQAREDEEEKEAEEARREELEEEARRPDEPRCAPSNFHFF